MTWLWRGLRRRLCRAWALRRLRLGDRRIALTLDAGLFERGSDILFLFEPFSFRFFVVLQGVILFDTRVHEGEAILIIDVVVEGSLDDRMSRDYRLVLFSILGEKLSPAIRQ